MLKRVFAKLEKRKQATRRRNEVIANLGPALVQYQTTSLTESEKITLMATAYIKLIHMCLEEGIDVTKLLGKYPNETDNPASQAFIFVSANMACGDPDVMHRMTEIAAGIDAAVSGE